MTSADNVRRGSLNSCLMLMGMITIDTMFLSMIAIIPKKHISYQTTALSTGVINYCALGVSEQAFLFQAITDSPYCK